MIFIRPQHDCRLANHQPHRVANVELGAVVRLHEVLPFSELNAIGEIVPLIVARDNRSLLCFVAGRFDGDVLGPVMLGIPYSVGLLPRGASPMEIARMAVISSFEARSLHQA